jgi:NAD(P)-dependent dehydrogenase (short-subunit alcohol dehydrogenase family)
MTPKLALITGGARGIGFGVAEAMLVVGYRVIVTGLTEGEVSAVPTRPHLSAVRLNVTDQTDISALFSEIHRLDALVNCAGMILRGGAEYNIEQFQKVMDVNLTGTMRMCLAAKSALAATGNGSIVNTASMLSFFGGPLTPAYAASKGAIVQLTKSLAVAWANDGIRVNAIAPGWISTELTKGVVADEARTAAIMARTPMKRWGKPEDVAGTVVHLCSDAAKFMTGAVVPIDGGYSIM